MILNDKIDNKDIMHIIFWKWNEYVNSEPICFNTYNCQNSFEKI